jgi:cbb3-type cytochrome c oxidase subunit III
VRVARHSLKPLVAALAVAAVALPLGSCGREEPDLINGKKLFVQKCGSCHQLGRAGTQGQTGPSLDASFNAALQDGFNRETVKGIVEDQIANVRRNSAMPANLVTGADATDVAAYVAYATSRSGEDQGRLATAGLEGATGGRQIFVAAGCGSCHAFSDAGTKGNVGPNLDELASTAGEQGQGSPEEYTQQSILDPDAVTAEGFQSGVMPSYEGRLSEKQVQALSEYLLGGQ